MITELRQTPDVDNGESWAYELRRELERCGVNLTRTNRVHELLNYQGPLMVTTTLCPLYAGGDLRESRLLTTGGISDSRVAVKWVESLKVNRAIQNAALRFGKGVHVSLAFADVGVINNNPSERDLHALNLHESLYREAAESEFDGRGIEWSFDRYSDIVPTFPRFIQTPKVPEVYDSKVEMQNIVVSLNEHVNFDPSVVNSDTGGFNKTGRKIIGSMLNTLGPELTRGLLMQYGVFDARISRPNALNVYYERGELLLNVTNLFEHKNRPRLDILCQ